MTSKKSSANKLSKSYDLKCSFKALIFPAVVSFIVAASIFVLKIINRISAYIEYGTNGRVDFDKTFSSIAHDYSVLLTCSSWFTNVFDTAFAIMVGVLFAFSAFLFLMKKNRVNIYLSSPLDRRALFTNRVTASCVLMAVTAAVPIIVDVIINMVIFGNHMYMLWHGLLVFAEYFVYMLVGFSIMSISMLACNTVIESLFFGAGELWLPTILITLCDTIASVFLRGYATNLSGYSMFRSAASSSFKQNILSSLSILNPLLFGKAIGDYYIGYNMLGFVCRANNLTNDEYLDSFSYYTPATLGKGCKWAQLDIIAPIIIWAVLCVGFMFIAKKLFLNRKAENAGIHSTSKIPSRIFAIEVSCVAFIIILALLDGIKFDSFIALFLSLIAFIIIYCIVMVISRRKIKLDKSTFRPAIISAVVVAAITLIFATGGLGYTNYVPELKDVELAVIQTNLGTITGDESAGYYSSTDNMASMSNSFEMNFTGAYCVCTEDEDIQKLLDVAKLVNKKTDNMTGSKVRVMYVLKNGKKLERAFKTTDYNYCFNALSLTDTDAYKNELKNLMLDEKANDTLDRIARKEKYDFINYIGLFGGYTERETNVIFNSGVAKLIFNDTINEIKIENTLELRKAIYEDKMSVDYTSRFRPEGKPLGEIIFYNEQTETNQVKDELDYEVAYAPSKTIRFYIDDSMKNTVAYLKSTGEYDAIISANTPDIKEVYYTSCKDYLSYYFEKSSSGYSNIHYIFNSLYHSKDDIEWNYADVDEYYSNFVKQLSSNPEIIEDKQKATELWDKSRSFAYASPEDYIAVFVLEDGTEIQRLIYADKF